MDVSADEARSLSKLDLKLYNALEEGEANNQKVIHTLGRWVTEHLIECML